MSYWGKYGELNAVDAASATLIDIANTISPEDLKKDYDLQYPSDVRYDCIRLLTQIEGLQMVIEKNNGIMPRTWLPTLYKKITYTYGK